MIGVKALQGGFFLIFLILSFFIPKIRGNKPQGSKSGFESRSRSRHGLPRGHRIREVGTDSIPPMSINS